MLFSFKTDYLSIGCKVMVKDENYTVSSFKDGSEIICHYNLNGGNQKNFKSSSSKMNTAMKKIKMKMKKKTGNS
jgi:hypothetical protein